MAIEIDADLSVFFIGEDWSGLDLTGCDLDGISFRDANMDGVTVYKYQFDQILQTGPRSMRDCEVILDTSDEYVQSTPKKLVNRTLGLSSENEAGGPSHRISKVPKLEEYIERISNSQSDKERKRIFREISSSGLTPTGALAGEFISKMNSFREKRKLLAWALRNNANPDPKNFIAVIDTARNFKEARAIRLTMEECGLSLGEPVFYALVQKASSLSEAMGSIDEMRRLGEEPSQAILSSVAKRWDVSKLSLDKILELGLVPDTKVMNAILEKKPTSKEFQKTLQTLIKIGVRPDSKTFELAMAKCNEFKEAKEILAIMRKHNFRTTRSVYNSMVALAPNFTEAKFVLAEMSRNHVKPDRRTFHLLLSQASSQRAALDIAAQMQTYGFAADSETFEAILNRSASYEIAHQHFLQMLRLKLNPSAQLLRTLVLKASSPEVARMLETVLFSGQRDSNISAYDPALVKAEGFQQSLYWLENILSLAGKPKFSTSLLLLQRADTVVKLERLGATVKRGFKHGSA